MTSFMNRSPVSTDVRLLDFQIRADKLINLGIFAPEKGGLAKSIGNWHGLHHVDGAGRLAVFPAATQRRVP